MTLIPQILFAMMLESFIQDNVIQLIRCFSFSQKHVKSGVKILNSDKDQSQITVRFQRGQIRSLSLLIPVEE